MLQIAGGVLALGASGWLFWNVSMDFMGLGSIIETFAGDRARRIVIGKIAFGFHLKMLGAWVLAITAGVLLS